MARAPVARAGAARVGEARARVRALRRAADDRPVRRVRGTPGLATAPSARAAAPGRLSALPLAVPASSPHTAAPGLGRRTRRARCGAKAARSSCTSSCGRCSCTRPPRRSRARPMRAVRVCTRRAAWMCACMRRARVVRRTSVRNARVVHTVGRVIQRTRVIRARATNLTHDPVVRWAADPAPCHFFVLAAAL